MQKIYPHPRRLIHPAILLAVLISVSHCEIFTSYDSITTFSVTPYPASCLLTLRNTVENDRISLTQTGNLKDCVFSPISMHNLFFDDYYNQPLETAVDTTTIRQSYLNITNIRELNGSSCILFPQGMTSDQYYICRMRFKDFYIYLEVFLKNTTGGIESFAPTVTGRMLPNFVNFQTRSQTSKTVALNPYFQDYYAVLCTTCGDSTDYEMDLDAKVIIKSYSYHNLGEVLPNMVLRYVLISKAYRSGEYMVTPISQYNYAFDQPFGPNCYQTPFTMKDLLPDHSFCAEEGCNLVFILGNEGGDLYLLRTNGFTYWANETGEYGMGSLPQIAYNSMPSGSNPNVGGSIDSTATNTSSCPGNTSNGNSTSFVSSTSLIDNSAIVKGALRIVFNVGIILLFSSIVVF